MVITDTSLDAVLVSVLHDEPFLSSEELRRYFRFIEGAEVSVEEINGGLERLLYQEKLLCFSDGYLAPQSQIPGLIPLPYSLNRYSVCSVRNVLSELQQGKVVERVLSSEADAALLVRGIIMGLALGSDCVFSFYLFFYHFGMAIVPVGGISPRFISHYPFEGMFFIQGKTDLDFKIMDMLGKMKKKVHPIASEKVDHPNSEYVVFGDYVLSCRLTKDHSFRYRAILEALQRGEVSLATFFCFMRGEGFCDSVEFRAERNRSLANDLVSRMKELK